MQNRNYMVQLGYSSEAKTVLSFTREDFHMRYHPQEEVGSACPGLQDPSYFTLYNYHPAHVPHCDLDAVIWHICVNAGISG